MKEFTNIGSETARDIVHMQGNDSMYEVTESNNALIYKTIDNARQYTISTSIETLKFKDVNDAGKSKFTWDEKFEPFAVKGSCKEWLESGRNTDGIYKIKYNGVDIDVYCDMTTDGGGWTRFLKYRDSVQRASVVTDKNLSAASSAYKIGIDETKLSYSEILLNDCIPSHSKSILINIPQLIKDEWVKIENTFGVLVSGSTFNSCNRTVERKEGGTWYYGMNHGGADEFETMFFATSCVSGSDSWHYCKWGAVDAGNTSRAAWGTANGIDHEWNNTSTYFNDWLCAFVR